MLSFTENIRYMYRYANILFNSSNYIIVLYRFYCKFISLPIIIRVKLFTPYDFLYFTFYLFRLYYFYSIYISRIMSRDFDSRASGPRRARRSRE